MLCSSGGDREWAAEMILVGMYSGTGTQFLWVQVVGGGGDGGALGVGRRVDGEVSRLAFFFDRLTGVLTMSREATVASGPDGAGLFLGLLGASGWWVDEGGGWLAHTHPRYHRNTLGWLDHRPDCGTNLH